METEKFNVAGYEHESTTFEEIGGTLWGQKSLARQHGSTVAALKIKQLHQKGVKSIIRSLNSSNGVKVQTKE